MDLLTSGYIYIFKFCSFHSFFFFFFYVYCVFQVQKNKMRNYINYVISFVMVLFVYRTVQFPKRSHGPHFFVIL